MLFEEKNNKIWTIDDPKKEKFLRTKTFDFNFKTYTQKEIDNLIRHMRTIMIATGGIGLSANQIGIDKQIFVAQEPNNSEKRSGGKFYAIFNPIIISKAKKTYEDIEGCLSIPNTYGVVERYKNIIIKGFNKRGKEIEIKAKDLLGRIFQHEIDHLNGILFIDKAKEIQKINEL